MTTPALMLRLGVACAAALALAGLATEPAVRALQPALVPVVGFAAADLQVLRSGFVRDRGSLQLVVMGAQGRTVVLHGQAHAPPQPPAPVVASIAAGTVLQAALVTLVLAAAWPVRRRCEWLLRLPLAALLLPPLLALDAPLALAGMLEHALHQQLGSAEMPALALWNRFLVAGGRLALGIAAGLAVVAAARAAAQARR